MFYVLIELLLYLIRLLCLLVKFVSDTKDIEKPQQQFRLRPNVIS